MGRNKEYRQRLKYQVSSALKKTLENQISVELRQNVGFFTGRSGTAVQKTCFLLRHQQRLEREHQENTRAIHTPVQDVS